MSTIADPGFDIRGLRPAESGDIYFFCKNMPQKRGDCREESGTTDATVAYTRDW